jgi:hypothetical protein
VKLSRTFPSSLQRLNPVPKFTLSLPSSILPVARMAPRKAPVDTSTERRRSSRIADKPKSPVEEKAVPKPRVKKVGKKRGAEGDAGEENGKPLAKKVCRLERI